MKKLFVFVVLCSLLSLLACASQPTAESVVQDVLEKMGGAEKLMAIEDQVSEGEFVMHVMPPDMPSSSDMEMMEEMPEDEETAQAEAMDEGMAESEQMIDEEMAESEMMAEETADSEMMSAGYAMQMRITYKKPNKIRMDMTNDNGETVYTSVYNGTAGWTNEMGEQIPMNEAEMQEYATMAKTWTDFLANHEEKGIEIKLLEDEMIDGETYHVLHTTDEFGNECTFHINAKTNLVEKQTGDMVNFEGEKEPMYMTFKNYRMFDGILAAEHVAQYLEDGTMLWEASLTDISNNTGVTDEMFISKEMTIKQ